MNSPLKAPPSRCHGGCGGSRSSRTTTSGGVRSPIGLRRRAVDQCRQRHPCQRRGVGYGLTVEELAEAGPLASKRRVWRRGSENKIFSTFVAKCRGRGRLAGPPVREEPVRRELTVTGPHQLRPPTSRSVRARGENLPLRGEGRLGLMQERAAPEPTASAVPPREAQ